MKSDEASFQATGQSSICVGERRNGDAWHFLENTKMSLQHLFRNG